MTATLTLRGAVACAGASAAGISATFAELTRGPAAFARKAAACAEANIASPVLKARSVQIANGFANRRKGFWDPESMGSSFVGTCSTRCKAYADGARRLCGRVQTSVSQTPKLE
jgi:hypothetical protein